MAHLATLASSMLEAHDGSVPLPNTSHYPAFAGWEGERSLKKLLRQILPMALCRTWEMVADHQAPGNVCFLRIEHLAAIAGRAPRTMEKHLASLCAKHLYNGRACVLLVRYTDGQAASRVVVITDFTGLSALAHDYHEWLADPGSIAPVRACIAVVVQHPQMMARLRRFENDRRLLSNHAPGPGPKQREKDRWFTDSQPAPSSGEEDLQEKQITAAIPVKTCKNPSLLPEMFLSKDLARCSPKRRSEEHPLQRETGDSLDSIPPSRTCTIEERASIQVALRVEEHAERGKNTPASCAPGSPPESSIPASQKTVSDLAAFFLDAISAAFGDRSPKGSQTRLRHLLGEIESTDVLREGREEADRSEHAWEGKVPC